MFFNAGTATLPPATFTATISVTWGHTLPIGSDTDHEPVVLTVPVTGDRQASASVRPVGQLIRSGAVSRCRNAVSRASRTVSRRRRSARIAASTYSGWFPGGGGGET